MARRIKIALEWETEGGRERESMLQKSPRRERIGGIEHVETKGEGGRDR